MKVVILTSSKYGTAGNHLPYLIESNLAEITMVIFNQGEILKKRKFYNNKILKIFRIGVLGALNGIRMRKWFDVSMTDDREIKSIEDISKHYSIPYFETPMINCETTQELFRKSGADLGISLGNGYIGQKIFSIPKFGMINIHHELLPEYQNAQSIIWQLYNRSTVTGYTIHKIDKNIDTGSILYQESVPIFFLETLPKTISKTSALLLESSAKGLLYCIENFESLYSHAKPQGKGQSYTTPTIRQYLRIRKNFYDLKKSMSQKGIGKSDHGMLL
ncbi:MAG: formyltransferase family protein [Ginsengibacter sp.]